MTGQTMINGEIANLEYTIKENNMVKTKYDRVIGIDPDVEKSGVTELHVESRMVNIGALSFPDLMDYLQKMKRDFVDKGEKVVVVVEAGVEKTIQLAR